MNTSAIRSILLVTSALAAASPTIADAQGGGSVAARNAVDSMDIIVTARRRDETSIAVPVVLTAVTGAELTRRGVNSADSLAQLVPGLASSAHAGSVQGGTIVLRGVAGPISNPLGDQAVSFNIDNVQIAKSSVRRLGFMDIQQVEVLKGPQALFFGKNSPGGIISLRTADPTPHFAAKASLGYEFNAHEWRGEGFVSGPLTDTLGARLAFYGSDMRGWVKNIVPSDSPLPPFHPYGPRGHEWAVRGTLKFDPTDAFSARLKISYGKSKGASNAYNGQGIYCPFGTTQLVGVVSDCKADKRVNRTDNIGTIFTQYEPNFRDGETYAESDQILAGLELNYKLGDAIDLTSVTGFYRNMFNGTDHYLVYPAVPILQSGSVGLPALVSYQHLKHRQISQELRANSSFDGPLNFTVGGIYTASRSSISNHAFANGTLPVEISQYLIGQKGTAYSAFGQARLDVTPQLELSAGGRYSHEKKTLPVTMADFTLSRTNPMVPFTPSNTQASWNDFSPELTVTYRPTDKLTLFGSYKRGFLSGGFNGSLPTASVPLDYGPQKIRGFEGGVKALLFDGALRTNLSAYSYSVPGLQITSFEIVNNVNIGTLRNAGGARTKGIEFDLNYRTPIDGLTVRGAISYNHARYTEYFGPCYTGQSQAMGCNLRALGGGQARPVLPGETGNAQDLAGRQLINAPEWAGNVGVSYETPLGSAMKLGLSSDLNFAGGNPTNSALWEGADSPKYALLSATMRIADAKDAWEVALIGRNLTEQYYWASGQNISITGSGPTGGVNPGRPSDAYAVPNRGREIMLRLTVAFGQ